MAVPPSPTVDQFVKVLKPFGTHWFDIGIYLGASTEKLKEIDQNHSTNGVVRYLAELHDCLAKKGKLTWESVATVLRELDNNTLADSISSNYILPAIRRASSNEDSTTSTTVQPVPMDIPTSDSEVVDSSNEDSTANTTVPGQQQVAITPTSGSQVIKIKDNLVDEIAKEFQSLSDSFHSLISKIWLCFESTTNINIPLMQALIELKCGLPPLPENEATVVAVFNRFQKKCSVLKFHPLMFIVDTFLSNETLKMGLVTLKASVDSFNESTKMIDLVSLIKSHQPSLNDDHKVVKLKLRNLWYDFTMKQFEDIMKEILGELYELLSDITVGTGCICVSWIIPPSVGYSKLLPSKLSLELLQIIGVISLHVGDDVIYNVGEEGCQTLKAAMLQAIELKNTRAIELLLAVGCSPEVATYNGHHVVTNVVNIRDRSVDDGSGGGVDHVCVLGHNKHIEAIIDPSRVPPKCATCGIKEKQIKQLYVQVDTLQLKNKDLCLEIETLSSESLQEKKEANINEKLTSQQKDKASDKRTDYKFIPPSKFPIVAIDEFVIVLKPFGTHWFDIGVYLGASTEKLKEIRKVYTSDGVVTCLAELHDCLAQTGKLTWESIATVLRELDNHALADSIHSKYILPAIDCASPNEDSTTSTTIPMDIVPTSDMAKVITIKDTLVDEIGKEFRSLSDRFNFLTIKIRRSFIAAEVSSEEMQIVVKRKCGLPPIPENEATVGAVFDRLLIKCSVLDFHPLMFAVNTLLSNEEALQMELGNLTASVDSFKNSVKMIDLVSLIKSQQQMGNDHKMVELKLRDLWHDFTMKEFEMSMRTILGELYELLSHITVRTGCICVSWIIPSSVDYTKLLPELSLEFLQIIGVIYLHIGDDVIYNNVGEEGCQTLEAAMLQAIELKNTRAIELLLAVGCSPEVASYNGDHAVTNVVNIRERSVDDGSGGGVDHVCVLGHNEHIEAIIDPNREPKCATCGMKEKQIKQLQSKVDTLQLKNKDLCLENDSQCYQEKKGITPKKVFNRIIKPAIVASSRLLYLVES